MLDDVKQLLSETLNKNLLKDNQKKRSRKIVLWYDSKKKYIDLIDELRIDNTEIIIYDNNSFWIRYYIEKEETTKNIVIYMPCERIKEIDNPLLDIESSNSDLIFTPDDITRKLKDLNLSEDCREKIKNYDKFFNSKKRKNEFVLFDIDKKTPDNIDYIITSILLGIKSISDDDILRNIVRLYFDDKKKYEDLFKMGNEEFILNIFNNTFGCSVGNHNELPEVYKSLVFTYFVSSISDMNKVSKFGKYILKDKATNVCIFVNSLMRDQTSRKYYDELAFAIEKEFGIDELVKNMNIDEYKTCDTFKCIDKHVLEYITDCIFEGIGEYLKYNEIIVNRQNKYWYDDYKNEYLFLKYTLNFFEEIEKIKSDICTSDIDKFVKSYANNLYKIDTLYRKIYYHYDNIEDKDIFIKLKNKVENKYINNFIRDLSIKWSLAFENSNKYSLHRTTMQNKFYNTYIKPYDEKKDRIIVIVSDAFRYECAKELTDRLKLVSSRTKINYMLGLVPSYTKLGNAALLPNRELSLAKNDYDILVDGYSSSSIKDKEAILQRENSDAMAIKYNDMYERTKAEWKKIFTGKKVVYIYHDTIDIVGEHNETKIFEACSNAINELEKLVKDLHTTFSGVNIFITADHGFFYKRGKIEVFEKVKREDKTTNKRFKFTDIQASEEGIEQVKTDYLVGYYNKYVNIPKGNMIYARQGKNSNYFHGGILPHEIIIPVIDFKSSRTKTNDKSKKVGITYSGLTVRITNAITYLEFLQDSNIDENNKPCRYLLHFEDENGNRVSNECIIIADYENTEVKDRFFKEKFVFKNIEYDRNKPYYLIIKDEETEAELPRVKFYIDISNKQLFINNE